MFVRPLMHTQATAVLTLTITVLTANPLAFAQDVPKNVNGSATALPAETYAATEQAAYSIGMLAYIWGYPLVEMYRLRDAITSGADPAGVIAPLNEFGDARRLVDDKLKLAHYPNADTIYSLAWLDLTKEPQVLHIPDTKGRYYVVPLCSAYNEIFASLGVRCVSSQSSKRVGRALRPALAGSMLFLCNSLARVKTIAKLAPRAMAKRSLDSGPHATALCQLEVRRPPLCTVFLPECGFTSTQKGARHNGIDGIWNAER
jgi:hypothetical protein